MKYKVGDKVKVREWDDMAKEFGVDSDGDIIGTGLYLFAKSMKKFCGKTVTIKKIHASSYEINEINGAYAFIDEMLEQPQLIIEHHGRTTVAHIGKTYGVARCNPDDKYDAMTGDILAVQRLYAKKIMLGDECYGVIGTPTKFHDTNTGETLKVGDFVAASLSSPLFTFNVVVHTKSFGDFIMGYANVPQSEFNFITKADDDYAMKHYGFKVIPCQQ